MGYRVHFDRENAILVLSAWGRVTDKAALEGYDLLMSCYKHYGNCSYIIDYTHATEVSISPDTVMQIAVKPPGLSQLCLQVIVAPQEETYKAARIFQHATAKTRPTLQVVHTMDEALKLLEARSPTFHELASSLDRAA
jgi:hypothetical protein